MPDDVDATATTIPGHAGARTGEDNAVTVETDDSFLRAVAGTPELDPGLQLGEVIDGSFRIEKKLGAGGMGVVFLATDLRLHREVAIKLHARGPSMAERTRREAKVMARLTHPNIITVYEVGEWRDRIYIAMEYLDGGTLRSWLDAGQRWREVLGLFLAAARGLAAAHDAGLIHRDFKPDNVLLGRDGRVRVADFGVARSSRAGEPELPAVEGAIESLTVAGAVVGTPGYMAPEAERGDEVDARADQYSFCVALRRALAQARPPRRIGRILARGLDPDAGERWPSMAALVRQLELALARRRRIVTTAIAVTAIAAVGVAFAMTRPAPDRRCTGAGEQLAAAWNPARALRVRGAVSRALGAARAGEVIHALDGWGRDWIDMHTSACLATVRGEQSDAVLGQRMLCLEGARHQLGAAAELIASDAHAALHASEEVEAMGSVARCGDLAAMGGLGPLPTDPEKVATISVLQAEVGAAMARALTGSTAETFQRFVALSARAHAAGWAPLIAQVDYQAGRFSDAGGESVGTYTESAAQAAVAGGDDEIAVAAWTQLGLTAIGHRDFEAAAMWLGLARASLERGHVDPKAEVELAIAAAQFLRAQSRFPEAIAVGMANVEAARHRGSKFQIARTLGDLGEAQLGAGQLAAALESLRAALALLGEVAAPDDDLVLGVRLRLTVVLLDLGRRDEAIAAARDLLDLVARTRAGANLERGDALSVIGSALVSARELDAARRALAEAAAIYRGLPHPDETRLAVVLANLATVDGDQGKSARAFHEADEVAATFTRLHGAADPQAIQATLLAAELAGEAGLPAEARRRVEAALAQATASLPPDAEERIDAERDAAYQLVADGHFVEAIPIAGDAEQRLRTRDPANLAEVRFTLARALLGAGRDRARALAIAHQSEQGFASLGANFDDYRREVAAWIAAHAVH